MINREQVEKCLAVLDAIPEENASLTVYPTGPIELSVYPNNWWRDAVQWNSERRHEILNLCTPLVGRLDKTEENGAIGYRGERDGLTVRLNYVDKCKILGYKTVTKIVKKEIEREPEYETEEVEERIAITDCDIKTGKFKEADIEVPS